MSCAVLGNGANVRLGELMKEPKILLVDDDIDFLDALRVTLRKSYAIETTHSPTKALEMLASKPGYGVIVVDLRMPEMDGITLLDHARALCPETTRVMLTGFADAASALDAVNRGKAFSVLTKPCPPEILRQCLDAGLKQYMLVRAEKELIHGTVRGIVKLLSELLSLAHPAAFGKATRVRQLAMDIGRYMGLPSRWRLDVAAMLSQIGLIALPDLALQRLGSGKPLSEKHAAQFDKHPLIASELIANIPRFKEVAEIVRYQQKRFNGLGPPQNERNGHDIPLESRILKLALDFDELEASFQSQADSPPAAEAALAELQQRKGWYDPQVLEALDSMINLAEGFAPSFLPLAQLKAGMVLDQTVTADDGVSVFVKGLELNKAVLQRLKTVARQSAIPEPIRVLVPPQQTLLVSELMDL